MQKFRANYSVTTTGTLTFPEADAGQKWRPGSVTISSNVSAPTLVHVAQDGGAVKYETHQSVNQ